MDSFYPYTGAGERTGFVQYQCTSCNNYIYYCPGRQCGNHQGWVGGWVIGEKATSWITIIDKHGQGKTSRYAIDGGYRTGFEKITKLLHYTIKYSFIQIPVSRLDFRFWLDRGDQRRCPCAVKDGGWQIRTHYPPTWQGRYAYPVVPKLRNDPIFQLDIICNDPGPPPGINFF